MHSTDSTRRRHHNEYAPQPGWRRPAQPARTDDRLLTKGESTQAYPRRRGALRLRWHRRQISAPLPVLVRRPLRILVQDTDGRRDASAPPASPPPCVGAGTETREAPCHEGHGASGWCVVQADIGDLVGSAARMATVP